jgi:hypothetical protein
MPKKLNPIQLLFIAIALAFVSCHTLVSDEFPDFKPVPVVNAILVAGKPVNVYVSLAGKLDTVPLIAYDKATVLLYVNQLLSDTLEYTESGFYTSDAMAEAGSSYRCEVKMEGFELVSAFDSIPHPLSVLAVEMISYGWKDEEGTVSPTLKVKIQNTPGTKCYYELRMSWGYLKNIVEPVILNEGLPMALFSNELIRDSVYTLYLNFSGNGAGRSGDGTWYTQLRPQIVELRTVSYEYYRYAKQLFLYEQGRYSTGLESPVTAFPLYSNVTNGYGIFAGYSASVSDTIKPTPYDR